MVDLNFLGVTDARELTEEGKRVVAKSFIPWGESIGSQTPARAGLRSGIWTPPVYRPDAPATFRIRGEIAAGLFAEQDVEIVCIGDSKTKGSSTGGGKQPERSWPGVVRRALGAVEGFIVAAPANEDDRWNPTNMERGTDVNLDGLGTINGASPSVFSFTYSEAHTGGSFWIYSAAGATVTITVDGGSGQSISVPAGGSYRQITPTVSGNTSHTYALTTSGAIRVYGFRPTFSVARLKITNLGRPSSAATSWATGSGGAIGLWSGFRTVISDPDVILCQHGTNGASGGGIPELFAQIVGVTDLAVVIAPGGIGTTPDTQFGPMYLAVWDQADLHNLPLVDNATVLGNSDEATARGLMADTVHENRRGQAWVASAILHLLDVT